MGCSGSKHETATILQESDVEISSSNVMHEGGERKLSTHAGVSAVVGATGSLSGGGNGRRFGPDEPSPASAVPAIPDQISTPMDEWDDEQLYAWVREELKSDGLHEEEVEHVLAVLRHNKIDSSVLVLLDETDLKDLGIRKQVALSLVAALAGKDARIAELEAASTHME